eukprot:619442-Rhodomonas_salina.1
MDKREVDGGETKKKDKSDVTEAKERVSSVLEKLKALQKKGGEEEEAAEAQVVSAEEAKRMREAAKEEESRAKLEKAVENTVKGMM